MRNAIFRRAMVRHAGFTKYAGKWLQLPVTFWDEEGGTWSRDTYGPNHKNVKELVKITAYKTGSKGKTPSLKFKYTDDGIYVLGNKSSMAYLARGYFHGINFPVCLSVCC